MFERTKLLLSEESFNILSNSTVLVVGVGGVGSIAVEALARSGVGKINIVDNDTIALSNLNRQVQTNYQNVGKSKVFEMVNYVKSIHPDIDIEGYELFFDKSVDEIFAGVDFVIDAIDTVCNKFELIEKCHELKIPMISSLAMGNRTDPTQLVITSLDKTSYDPLAKVLRKMAKEKRMNTRKIKVVFSKEQPMVQKQVINAEGLTRKQKMPPASMFIVPPASGLACVSYCIDYLINNHAII
ncbi:MAG: tRNA threonylcarbamoyladenosine dehydratase [Erysipelothrix sp.]|nr:tRNA threonylcarbamoyladenosine dehydratase [Erysipelothrix sp.]